uniref:DUF4773 domain-containing protein n=2 Tax=Bombyx mori TaxID=7091 RepID=A0A8R2HSW9_BOMMO|nr:uncharacterized protein LOC101737971 [Bombyx mori]
MTNVFKIMYFRLFILILFIKAYQCDIEFDKDKEKDYNEIKFKIPKIVWKQAFDPTPILRSPITIVLPIHVQQDDNNEIAGETDDIDTENVAVDSTLVEDSPADQNNPELVEDTPVSISSLSPVSTVTQATDVEPEQEVVGQVIRFPCSCISGQCGCCTGAILERFKMKTCGNISFVPEDFVFDVRLSVNNNTVVRRRVSASDPPPICFNPRRAPFVRVCAEISNIRIRNRNAFACLEINADIGGFTIYSASFRCFSLGSKGLQTGLKPKPVSSGPTPVSLFGNSNNEDEGGFLENAAGAVFGGDEGGLFGGSDGLFGGGNDEGPLDTIGDAIGDFFDGRKID